ncbi:hypothetical protein K1T71_000090 [Dendrolimus kikuchii]|uniref:Uncharacterized protein n=1 Tax=Dendrolimus kikuchii TaxID=765133 RepID=A0ACC1DJS8_9NEOP|nr:hypothetical protein K1T71_000090 [Dendrolimus kikuchii]
MFISYKYKDCLSWPLIRAHLCTLAVSLSFNSTWRVPRDGFRYGGLAYAIALTLAVIAVALPITLLQLAIGQLSQQDAVGVWRAVPFFRGVGYMRVLISFLASVYTSIYVALTLTYFFYTISHSIPFWECIDAPFETDIPGNSFNASECVNQTFLSPNDEKPEYFMATALILVALWISFPFLFYNTVKLMKRIFYVLGPLVLLACISIVSALAGRDNISSFTNIEDWLNYIKPSIWHGAVVQALWSTQIAGGFLILAGDSIYLNTNVQWTTLAITGANVITSWVGLLFWFSISLPDDKDTGMVTVLVQIYATAYRNSLNKAWPLCMFATIFLSGVITMLVLLYPVYDFIRRIGYTKWRLYAFTTSAVAAAVSIGVLAGRLPVLYLLEDVAVPLLISIATVVEILAFVLIYGWKVLVEDVEFLTGRDLPKYWVWGWCAAPGVIVPFTAWWLALLFIKHTDWTEPPWEAITVVSTFAIAFIVFSTSAGVAVAKQVQYDIVAKLKSSFKPSRHWGPRDPITHYFWLARREEARHGDVLRNRYNRRQLGQLSGGSSFLNITPNQTIDVKADINKRSNSDDFLYTVYRRRYLAEAYHEFVNEKRRSKSMDWSEPKHAVEFRKSISSVESNTNVVLFNNFATQRNILGRNGVILQRDSFKLVLCASSRAKKRGGGKVKRQRRMRNLASTYKWYYVITTLVKTTGMSAA